MSTEQNLKEIQKEWHGTVKSYIIGFFGSLILTGISFLLVFERVASVQALFYILISLALLQATVQLLFFLHVGQEAKPKWETIVFCMAVVVLLIIVAGTLWVMFDLQERVMPMSNMFKENSHD